ncbi:MAG TPA: hypothetical protein PKN99_03800 [Cyclobacteriaceae bacterium]|nr:hypothetical protein [Cyclobacteriaceae bacterium]
MESSIRRKRFEKVAGNRINIILSKLNSLSNCANKNNYEYDEDDVRKMFKAIREKLASVEKDFSGQLNKDSKSEFKF